MAEGTHPYRYIFKMWATQLGMAATTINPPGKQHMTFIYFTTTTTDDDPSDVITPTLQCTGEKDLPYDLSEYSEHMLIALSAMGVPEAFHRSTVEKLYRRFALLWERDLPITWAIGRFAKSTAPTVATLHRVYGKVYDMVRDIVMERDLRKLSLYLEKVTLDDDEAASTSFTCCICQEGLHQLEAVQGDTEARTATATRLPCSHIYHETCIVRWLQISRLCPMCRHPMPTAQVAEQPNPV